MFFKPTVRAETARLESESMAAVGQACLELWHYTEGWIVGRENILVSALPLSTDLLICWLKLTFH